MIVCLNKSLKYYYCLTFLFLMNPLYIASLFFSFFSKSSLERTSSWTSRESTGLLIICSRYKKIKTTRRVSKLQPTTGVIPVVHMEQGACYYGIKREFSLSKSLVNSILVAGDTTDQSHLSQWSSHRFWQMEQTSFPQIITTWPFFFPLPAQNALKIRTITLNL